MSFTSTNKLALLRSIKYVSISFCIALTLSHCASNPATGGANIVLMSESGEKELGAEEHLKILASTTVYEDPELLAYVTKVGKKVAAVSHRPDLEYHFTIIDSPEINAFALPGGYVYMNRGLLSYMNTEAELAAVLAHEIGHITARHSVQRHTRQTLARTGAAVGGFVTAVATGSGQVGSQISEIASIWAQTGISGFGREQELEADSLGAEYLYAAGYDPTAMIDVITVLKNQEDFKRRTSNGRGGYHGLFATHPRNDKRLQESVANVGNLDSNNVAEIDHADFRDSMNGLPVGEGKGSQTRDERNRYYQDLLAYTLVFPNEWEIEETTTTVTAAAEGVGKLTIEAQRIRKNIEPRLFVRDELGLRNLQKSETINQYGLIGHTGIIESAQPGKSERIAAIYFGPRVFVFRGEIESGADTDEVDELLRYAISTFRPTQRNEISPGNELKIKFVQAGENFTFTQLASNSRITEYPEETLRIMNGYYPRGEPEPGTWIKVIE